MSLFPVTPGLIPEVLDFAGLEVVNARHEAGHDGLN